MKKIVLVLLMMLAISGCSTASKAQTLFVEKDGKYALCDSEGELKTKFKYSDYVSFGNVGYLVSQGKKTSYISKEGKDIISYKKGVELSSLEKMVIGKNDDRYIIYNQDGKELYKDSKKVKIYLYELPVVYKDKKYHVLDSNGDVLYSSKKEIKYVSVYNEKFVFVAFDENSLLLNSSDEEKEIELVGKYKIINQDYKKGYLLYSNDSKSLVYIDLDGKVVFDKNIEITSGEIKGSTIVVKNDKQIRMISLNGKEDIIVSSYYNNIKNYLVKNASYIYGPHEFVSDGKSKEVKGVQLNPNLAYAYNKTFPVYVQNKGYQYWNYNGDVMIKTYYKDANDFDKNGLAVVSKDNNKYYLIDKTGNKVSKKYVDIKSLGEGYYAGYTTSSKYEVINTKGEVVIVDYFMGEGKIFIFDDITYGLLNKSGTTYLYDMDNVKESIVALEGEYKLYQNNYIMSKEKHAYYDLEGNLIYKE